MLPRGPTARAGGAVGRPTFLDPTLCLLQQARRCVEGRAWPHGVWDLAQRQKEPLHAAGRGVSRGRRDRESSVEVERRRGSGARGLSRSVVRSGEWVHHAMPVKRSRCQVLRRGHGAVSSLPERVRDAPEAILALQDVLLRQESVFFSECALFWLGKALSPPKRTFSRGEAPFFCGSAFSHEKARVFFRESRSP